MEVFKDVLVEAEPGSIQDWLSITQQGNKIDNGTRRSYLSIKVKKHLSPLGWVFSYAFNDRKREMRYKSPDGKLFHSLADACLSCVDDDVPRQQQQQIVLKPDLPCCPRNLDASNQKHKKRKDRYTTTFKAKATNKEKTCSSDCFEIVLNIDVSNQKQKKRRKVTFGINNSSTPGGDKVARRTVKSLNKVLQVMEKKNNKCDKEYVRFWRKDCGSEINYDVCCFCHRDGELLLCDGCPSAFHYTCLGFWSLPKEELWFCPCCCCDVCGSIETSRNSKLMTCEQCQRRFHLKCLKQDQCLVSYRGWFCSRQCSKVSSSLQSLLGRKITVMIAPNEDEHYADDEQISKLSSTVKILHQGFEPTKDPLSGRDLVEELTFKKDGLGLGLMIEKNNEPITVAAMRVEKDVAEIPLVATLSDYRRRGMCRVLMDELEKQMSGMGVCRLLLPAAADVVNTWTRRFGFSVMERWESLELVKHGMLHFAGTVMCHKSLIERRVSEESSLTQ